MKILITSHTPLSSVGSATYITSLIQGLMVNNEVGLIGHLGPDFNAAEIRLRFPAIKYIRNCCRVGADIKSFDFHADAAGTFEDRDCDIDSEYFSVLIRQLSVAKSDFNPDIVHVNHLWLYAAAATQLSLPVVVTCHGPELAYLVKHAACERKKDLLRVDFPILCASQHLRSELSFAIPEISLERIHVAPFGPSVPAQVQQQYVPRASSVVVYGGKLTERKNFPIILSAAKYLHKKCDLRFDIFGEGPLENWARSFLAENELTNVTLHGNQQQDTYLIAVRKAAVYVSPCPSESLCLSALEALSLGIPVVAAAAGAHLEYITNDCGRLFLPNDYLDLSSKLVDAWGSKWGDSRAYHKIALRYSMSRHIQDLIAIYCKIYEGIHYCP